MAKLNSRACRQSAQPWWSLNRSQSACDGCVAAKAGAAVRFPRQRGGLLHSGLVRALRYAEEVGALSAEQAAHWRASGWQVMLRLAEK